jgi:hypothetical protein
MTKKHDAEIQRLIDIVNTSAVNRISKPFKVEDAYKPKKKEELQEAIKIMVDTPEEAMAMMQILKSAGLGDKMPDMKRPDMPMKQDMENEQDEIEQGADYRNSPDEKYDNDDPLDTYSTKPNKQVKFRRTGSAGDNPLTMAEELMAEWQESKNTTEEVIGEDMVDDLKAKIDKLAKKPNLSKEEAAELDKLEDRLADIETDLDE